MNEHLHSHEPPAHPAAEAQLDAGSQALSEALRASFAIVKFAMVLLVLVFLGSGFFTVGPQERAVILRFGKPVGEGEKALLGPGLHWSFPYPIDEYIKIPITEIQSTTSTIGWYAMTPEQELAGTLPPPRPSLNPATEGYVLTADRNIVHVRSTLYYRISDPIQFVFTFTNAAQVVQNALNNALLWSAARFKADDILYRDFARFRETVQKRATDLLEVEHVGVTVERCDVERTWPLYLAADFDNVTKADNARNQKLEEANSYANQATNRASAEAKSIVDQAESERVRLVADVASFATNFAKLLPIYRTNQELFVQQRLTETLGRTLTNVQDKIYLQDRGNGKTPELRLLLNRELPKPSAQ